MIDSFRQGFYRGQSDAELKATWADVHHAFEGVYEVLCRMDERLDEIARLQRRKEPHRELVVIGGGGSPPTGIPLKLTMRGYRHARLWLPAAATLTVDITGANGPIGASISFVAGWNVLDAGNDAYVAASTSATINAVLELTDDIVQ